MLELNHLHYAPATSKTSILTGVSLKASIGQPVIVAGASGSGKTSLLEVISGLSLPSSGNIRWKGKKISRKKLRSLCGMVFQFPERHFLGLTVRQELRLGHRRFSEERQAKVLNQVGLNNVPCSMPPERLSGGQQRRLAMAVQIDRGADVLLLDEPTAGLDWSVRLDMLALMSDIARDKVLIVVTHEPYLFNDWDCNRYHLRDGKLTPFTKLQ